MPPLDGRAAPEIVNGQVAERSKAHAWKACRRATVSWVRIPPCPPSSLQIPREFGSGCAFRARCGRILQYGKSAIRPERNWERLNGRTAPEFSCPRFRSSLQRSRADNKNGEFRQDQGILQGFSVGEGCRFRKAARQIHSGAGKAASGPERKRTACVARANRTAWSPSTREAPLRQNCRR